MGKYTLMYNAECINYVGDDEVEVGKVVDQETGNAIIYVHYSRDLYKESRYHMCFALYEDEDGDRPVAQFDDLHRACFIKQPNIFLCMILHEYGHYLNGDYNAPENITDQFIRQERERCIKEGKVMEMEQKADAFAVAHVGKNTFMRCMDYLIQKRRERTDSAMSLAIKEFELRKKAARKLR